jgi:(1->4)-alpha-D-glucan 1-alpha-D-glucosylmutase
VVEAAKREVADGTLRAEVLRLERDLARSMGGPLPEASVDAIAELLTCFPVYRSYLPDGRQYLDAAAQRAAARRPDLAAAIAAIVPVLADPRRPVAVRFQQTSGMVMAKGVEDRAFFRFDGLTSLTEVGADPAEESVDVNEFHRRQHDRQDGRATSLTALSTHDTKRAEDVRARISVLAEVADEWTRALRELRRVAPLPDPAFEQLFWQATVGAWPITLERLRAYAVKAGREAATGTSWIDPDARFEATVGDVVERVFDDPSVRDCVEWMVALVEAPGRVNSLSAKLIALTIPGVPDVYQGSELWDLSLVDPDNRRPVDYAERAALLGELDAGWLPPVDGSGAAKLLVTSRALRLRRDRPELFTRYEPRHAIGPAAAHVVAFDRGGAVTVATRLPIGLERTGGWRGTTIEVGRGAVQDMLTGARYPAGPIQLDQLLSHYPVALLIPTLRTGRVGNG